MGPPRSCRLRGRTGRGEGLPRAGAVGAGMRAAPTGARRARPAVTLPELIVVVLLMGLLTALVVPRLARSSIWASEGKAAAKQVAATLRLARQKAIEHGAENPSGYKFQGFAASYRIEAVGGDVGDIQELPEGWQFELSNYAVWFDPYGGIPGWMAPSTELAIVKPGERWLVRFDTATGYAWYEEG